MLLGVQAGVPADLIRGGRPARPCFGVQESLVGLLMETLHF
jgi:hypothetical protein